LRQINYIIAFQSALRQIFKSKGINVIVKYAKNLLVEIILLNPRRLVGIVNVIPPYFGPLAIHAKHNIILVRIPFFTDLLDIVIDMLIKSIDKHFVIYDIIRGYVYLLK
jgi:hypothetical protein